VKEQDLLEQTIVQSDTPTRQRWQLIGGRVNLGIGPAKGSRFSTR
jgi:hypothetical protein